MSTFTRDSVLCAASFNVCSLILLLFATISTFWTWGTGIAPLGSGSQKQLTVSYSPWIAGHAWTTFAFPCNCVGGICYNACVAGSQSLMWSDIEVDAVCDVMSNVYRTWAGPLGYCSFPGGIIPKPNRNATADNKTGSYYFSTPQNIPTGTTFNRPSSVISMQALTIIATVTCCFSIGFGCADAAISRGRSKTLAFLGMIFGLCAWVFALASVCTWATFPYVLNTQVNPPTTYVPIWVNSTANEIGTVTVLDMFFGPAWATMLAAMFMLFFSNMVQCVSLRFNGSEDDHAPAKNYAISTGEVPLAVKPVPPVSNAVTTV